MALLRWSDSQLDHSRNQNGNVVSRRAVSLGTSHIRKQKGVVFKRLQRRNVQHAVMNLDFVAVNTSPSGCAWNAWERRRRTGVRCSFSQL